jgi:hypothetical protein
MKNPSTFLLLGLLFFTSRLAAQTNTNPPADKVRFSLETEVPNFFQSGFSAGASLWLPNSHWSFGVAVAGSEQRGNTRNIIFSNGDQLDRVRNTWLVRAEARYHLRTHQEGLYASLRVGYEEFEATLGDVSRAQNNAFVTPGLGYTWFVKGRKGFFIQPYAGVIVVLGRGEARTIGNVTYQLNGFFPNPNLAVGWKF